MSILDIPSDVVVPKKDRIYKDQTTFERRRGACETYDELFALGCEYGMDFPDSWAEYVIDQRRRNG